MGLSSLLNFATCRLTATRYKAKCITSAQSFTGKTSSLVPVMTGKSLTQIRLVCAYARLFVYMAPPTAHAWTMIFVTKKLQTVFHRG